MTYFILAKVSAAPSRIPRQQRHHFVFISCWKCHSSLHPNDISFVYSVFTATAPNEQHKQTQWGATKQCFLLFESDPWNCLRLTASEAPRDAWSWHRAPRRPLPVHISIHNMHAGSFNHSYISNEIQLQTVINDGVLISANNWPSAMWHTDTLKQWPKGGTSVLKNRSASSLNYIKRLQPFYVSKLSLKTSPDPRCPDNTENCYSVSVCVCVCVCTFFF